MRRAGATAAIVLAGAALAGCEPTDAGDTASAVAAGTSTSPPATAGRSSTQSSAPTGAQTAPTAPTDPAAALVPVLGVIDGDTIAVRLNGARTKVRLIGVDTPETRKPNTPVQCYGKQAGSRMQSLVQSRTVHLVADPSQSDKDRYGRLLRYVAAPDGRDVGLLLVAGGFAREYTYDTAYARQDAYRAAQIRAQGGKVGLWGACTSFGAAATGTTSTTSAAPPSTAPGTPAVPPAPPSTGACDIKGNINSEGEKIYHLPGSRSYAATKITPSEGERYFCSEADAVPPGGVPPATDPPG